MCGFTLNLAVNTCIKLILMMVILHPNGLYEYSVIQPFETASKCELALAGAINALANDGPTINHRECKRHESAVVLKP